MRKNRRKNQQVKGNKKAATKPAAKPVESKAPAVVTAQTSVQQAELITVDMKMHRDNNDGHHHIIVDNYENKHVSVGTTTDPFKGKNHPNIHLGYSVLNNEQESHMHRQGTVDLQSNYYNPHKGQMTLKDFERAKQIGEKAKLKHIAEQEKKKNNKPNNT